MENKDETFNEKKELLSNNFANNKAKFLYLPNDEKIYYNATILVDMFFIEDLNEFYNGLDSLYTKLLPASGNLKCFDSRLDYRNIFPEDRYSPYYNQIYLPRIRNTRYYDNDKFIKDSLSAYHDLGPDIESLFLTLNVTLPSTIFLQIQANLAPHISENMCDIICKQHESVEEVIQTAKGEVRMKLSQAIAKERDILAMKNKIKEQTVNFLSTYFEGFFFTKAKKHISYVPCVDIYSLTYPENPEDLKVWLHDNTYPFGYFNIESYLPGYKHEEYLFLESDSSDEPFTNFSILVNRKLVDTSGFQDIEDAIQYRLTFISFDLLSSFRWLEVIGKTIRDFHKIIIQEWGDSNKSDINKLISNRQSITKELFYFERFKTEIIASRYRFRDDIKFTYLDNSQNDLFGILLKRIDEEVKNISATTVSINSFSNDNLNLKNIEFNYKTQKYILYLSIFLFIFTFIQIILTVIQINNRP